MSTGRLEKVVRDWSKIAPSADALESAQRMFTSYGYEYLQRRFDKLNEQFFGRRHLPKVLIFTGRTSNLFAGFFMGRAIFVGTNTLFTMNLVLLHEMLHLRNDLYGIRDADHTGGWIDSIKHINAALNIIIDPKDLTIEEREDFPLLMMKNFGFRELMERDFFEFGEIKPLPDGFCFERSTSQNKEKTKAICTGDVSEDINTLEETFGPGYVKSLLNSLNNNKGRRK